MPRVCMPKCLYCGNNPTPHAFSWFNESFILVMNPLNRVLFGSRIGKWFARLSDKIFQLVLWFFHLVGALKYNQDIKKVKSSRGEVLWEEANRRGIPMESVSLFGKDIDCYRAVVVGKSIFFTGLPRPEYTESGAEWWMDDKAVLKEKLMQAGIPVARGGSFSRYERMREVFKTLEKPVIVKPRLGSRGRHTTTWISTEEELEKAFTIAKQLCYWVVMEEHLVGSVYRGTVIDGVLAGVLAGDPPRVTGDGVHTIEALVAIKNANKNPKIKDVVLSNVHTEFLTRSDRTLSDVLPAGETIDLLEKIGISYGGNSAEVTEITHPETKKFLEAAARTVNDPLIGFDFIIKDIGGSPHTQKWGIIECNGVPFINLHHDPIEGKSNNVAKYVWDFVERYHAE